MLTEPLEVAAVVFTFSGFFAGVAGAVELLSGRTGTEIADAAAKGAAAGFIVGLVAAVAASLYLVAR